MSEGPADSGSAIIRAISAPTHNNFRKNLQLLGIFELNSAYVQKAAFEAHTYRRDGRRQKMVC